MEPKILRTSQHHICLYCGEEIPVQYDEFESYYECKCPNAHMKREIKEKIKELERSIPNYNYMIIQESVLHKLKFEDGEVSICG